MNPRRSFLCLLAFCLILGLARTTPAQPSPVPLTPSHKLLNNLPTDPEQAKRLLRDRLATAKEMNDLDKMVAKLLKDFDPSKLTPEQQKELMDVAAKQAKDKPIDLKDHPDLAKILKDKLPGLDKSNLSPEDLKALEKAEQQQHQGGSVNLADHPGLAKTLQKILDGNKTELAKDTSLDVNKMQDLLKTLQPAPGQGPGTALNPGNMNGPPPGEPPPMKSYPQGPGNPPTPPLHGGPPQGMGPSHSPAPPKPPPPPPVEKQTWLAQQFVDIVQKIDLHDDGENSLGGFLKQLVKTGGDAPAGTNNLPNVNDYVPAEKVKDATSFLSRFKMPSLPNFGSVAPPAPKLPSAGAGAAGGTESALHVLIGTLVVVLAGVLVWKLMGIKNALVGKGDNLWHVGSWPVHPSAVRTRADLVKAFEYLAVLVLGPQARTHHHLELAEELGQQARAEDARTGEAARTLAYLYELARYTPANETLPPDELATARRELSFLAGAAPA
jgi:hypothetical protein